MNDVSKMAHWDQALAYLGDNLAGFLAKLHRGLIEDGMGEAFAVGMTAHACTQVIIAAMADLPRHPPTGQNGV